MTAGNVELRSARGERLAGILHVPEGPEKGFVVLSPCFTCSKDIAPVRNLARDLEAAGFRALRFDPSGNGQSEGRFEDATVSKHVDDLLAIAGERDVHLAGHSLGGVVSLLAAGRSGRVRSVITMGSNARIAAGSALGPLLARARSEGAVEFDSGDRVKRRLTREFALDAERHDALAAARGVRNLLVIHGDQDETVPFEAARDLEAAGGKLVAIPGAGHLLSRGEDRARIRDAVIPFLLGLE